MQVKCISCVHDFFPKNVPARKKERAALVFFKIAAAAADLPSADQAKSEPLFMFFVLFTANMQTMLYRDLPELRLGCAAKLLRETYEPVTNIANMVGFLQVSYFGKSFNAKTGYSSKEYWAKYNSKQ